MIWRRVLVPETMSLHELHGVLQVAMGWEAIHLFQFSVRGVTPADAMVQIGSTPHAPDQNPRARRHAQNEVPALVSRALQRGKLKSGNGTNSSLTPEILVVPCWSAVGYGVGIVELPCLRKSGPQMSAELLG